MAKKRKSSTAAATLEPKKLNETTHEEPAMPLTERIEAVRFGTSQILDILEQALDGGLSNEASCVALIARSKDLASAMLDLFDDSAVSDEIHGPAKKTIFAGL
jgi:hypothetical protein